MQAEFQKCKFLIVDKKSMIEFKMLYQIDMRLRSVMACPDVFFGGINVCAVNYLLLIILKG